MGSNTGKSDVTILQHMCYAIVYVAEGLVEGLVPKRQLNTDCIYIVKLRLGKKFPSRIETLSL